ncbi:FRG domain-containing protein [Vibrio gigantis]|uniref:FRG domain-containing protein n=1 Tax=Vibrio TaxID=662 RepID=UPI001FE881FC|nr:FRG domain-containing protein [Vibrio tasmaniensis]
MNMEMTTFKISSLELLHKLFSCHTSRGGFGYWFRGQANASWELLPSAGRDEYLLPKDPNRDLGRCFEWTQSAIAMTELTDSIIENLAIAQHHGLATRLLDWTLNPLVACYFAVSSEIESDAVIYVLESISISDRATHSMSREALAHHHGVICYQPKAINRRLISQQGLFTVHCPPSLPFPISRSVIAPEETNIRCFILPKELKKEIKAMLDNYGVNEATLFPDLDGLARYVNRKTKEMKQ